MRDILVLDVEEWVPSQRMDEERSLAWYRDEFREVLRSLFVVKQHGEFCTNRTEDRVRLSYLTTSTIEVDSGFDVIIRQNTGSGGVV